VNTEFNYDKFFAMIPSGPDPKPSFTVGFFEAAVAQNPKPQTVAFVAADQEFSKNACDGAKENAKKHGLKTVYDRAYPPSTTDFSPVVRAIQAANPDIVAVCSYPLDSVGLVKAVNEINFKPKMIGGAMVGLQATGIQEPSSARCSTAGSITRPGCGQKMMYAGTEDFFKKYQGKAASAGVDPLGYYLGGWGYAYAQVLGAGHQRDQGA